MGCCFDDRELMMASLQVALEAFIVKGDVHMNPFTTRYTNQCCLPAYYFFNMHMKQAACMPWSMLQVSIVRCQFQVL